MIIIEAIIKELLKNGYIKKEYNNIQFLLYSFIVEINIVLQDEGTNPNIKDLRKKIKVRKKKREQKFNTKYLYRN